MVQVILSLRLEASNKQVILIIDASTCIGKSQKAENQDLPIEKQF